MTRIARSSLRSPRTERPGFVTDAEPLGILGLEALIDRLVWRAGLGDASC